MRWRVLVSLEVLDFVERLPRRISRDIRIAVRAIENDPLGLSDAVTQDQIGRRLEVAVVGDHVLIYWIDHADKQVKILEIHAADR